MHNGHHRHPLTLLFSLALRGGAHKTIHHQTHLSLLPCMYMFLLLIIHGLLGILPLLRLQVIARVKSVMKCRRCHEVTTI